MADIALSVVQTLFAALQSKQLKDVFSIWGYKSQLNDLEDVVSTVRNVLLDVEGREDALSIEEREYVEKLKDAVYDADDLFDEVITLAELKSCNKSDKLSKKVRSFFSPNNNSLSIAYTMSREVKKISKRLDGITSNHSKFRFKFDSQPIRRRGEETCSYVYASDVVGRDDDVKAVLHTLLDFSVDGNIGFLTIVGVGGLGKTTLAQLVYCNERVILDFELRLWVCISDQDGKDFDVKVILSRILESAGHKLDDGSSMERVQSQFQKSLGGKKCLLVLDDVWNEDCYKWQELRGFLMRFGGESRIIITSRSKESARIIGNDHSCCTYELGGLSEEKSWYLFQLVAFGRGHEHLNQPELVEIGKKIVKRCYNVPLAIKVVGSLLFGQEKSKWRAFEEDGLGCLANTSQNGNLIMSILKLSYDNLNSSVKSCFSYCALFPKGFRIRKEMLIGLWMSQGYTKPFYDGQNIEEAANEQFSILLRRCFFQDVEMDEYGDVESCKIHDLMHDVAREVAGKEICAASSIGNNCKVRHLYEDREYFEQETFTKSKIRSYIQLFEDRCFLCPQWETMLAENWVCLRALTMHNSPVKRLPDAIGKLLHLRNLDLHSCQKLETLPNSITKLHNLQTLILANCESLKELPKDLSKLVNIRHLDIRGCRRLTCMPEGLHKLSSLTTLPAFYVAAPSSNKHIGQLGDLKDLNHLKGGIEIIIPEHYASVEERNHEGDILSNMEHINSVTILFNLRCGSFEDERNVKHESLIEKLQPHSNLKGLELQGYKGQTIPTWGKTEHNWGIFFPYLVKIRLDNCCRLQELPRLSELEHLKSLKLSCLYNVEYLEEFSCSRVSNGASFFPSLEYLYLHGMLKLRGLIKVENDKLVLLSFPRLYKLEVLHCPNLISLPSCPALETLGLREVNERLKLINVNPKVRDVNISNVTDLKTLPPCHPSRISITAAMVETFSEASNVFKTRGSASVRHLQIDCCGKLRSLSGGGLEHLTTLESLDISYCSELSLNDEYFRWGSFHQNLVHIKLNSLQKLENLPTGMQELRSLRHLIIEFCQNFRRLPEWISCLSALHSVAVRGCGEIRSLPEAMWSLTALQCLEINPCSKELKERCDPGGVDWPKIQHISDVSLYSWDGELISEALRMLFPDSNTMELY